MGDVDILFKPLLGQLVWGCRRGDGPAMTLEFGEPRLVVREPIAGSKLTALRRRRVTVTGHWHFWVLCDYWALTADSRSATENSEATLLDDALQKLDGQRLSQATHDAGSLTMAFDLGGCLRLLYKNSEQRWTLYEREMLSTSLGVDGMLTVERQD